MITNRYYRGIWKNNWLHTLGTRNERIDDGLGTIEEITELTSSSVSRPYHKGWEYDNTCASQMGKRLGLSQEVPYSNCGYGQESSTSLCEMSHPKNRKLTQRT